MSQWVCIFLLLSFQAYSQVSFRNHSIAMDLDKTIELTVLYPGYHHKSHISFNELSFGNDKEKQYQYWEYFIELADEYSLRLSKVNKSLNSLVEKSSIPVIPILKDGKIRKSREAYPIIIYLPGLGLSRNMNIFDAIELVKQGYVVVNIDHALDSKPRNMSWDQLIDKRARDGLIAIDFIRDVYSSIFTNENLIIWGYSLGGATALRLSKMVPEVKSIINLDGSIFNQRLEAIKSRPSYLLIANIDRKDLKYNATPKYHADFGQIDVSSDQFVNLSCNHLEFTNYHQITGDQRSVNNHRYISTFINTEIEVRRSCLEKLISFE